MEYANGASERTGEFPDSIRELSLWHSWTVISVVHQIRIRVPVVWRWSVVKWKSLVLITTRRTSIALVDLFLGLKVGNIVPSTNCYVCTICICLDLTWFICEKWTWLILFRHKWLECAVYGFLYRYFVLVRFIVFSVVVICNFHFCMSFSLSGYRCY